MLYRFSTEQNQVASLYLYVSSPSRLIVLSSLRLCMHATLHTVFSFLYAPVFPDPYVNRSSSDGTILIQSVVMKRPLLEPVGD